MGCLFIVWLRALPQTVYPEPFNTVSFLLSGSVLLQSTLLGLMDWAVSGQYVVAWLIIGLAIAPFSKPNWNALRSALWVGLFIALLATGSILITNPSFWYSPSRNMDLITLFTSSLIASPLSLLSCIPISLSAAWLTSGEATPPEKIETVCECGAVFKSRPVFCSECGRQLTGSDAQ